MGLHPLRQRFTVFTVLTGKVLPTQTLNGYKARDFACNILRLRTEFLWVEQRHIYLYIIFNTTLLFLLNFTLLLP